MSWFSSVQKAFSNPEKPSYKFEDLEEQVNRYKETSEDEKNAAKLALAEGRRQPDDVEASKEATSQSRAFVLSSLEDPISSK